MAVATAWTNALTLANATHRGFQGVVYDTAGFWVAITKGDQSITLPAVYRSTDGITWSALSSLPNDGDGGFSGTCQSRLLSPRAGWILAAKHNVFLSVGLGRVQEKIYLSQDSGATWAAVYTSPWKTGTNPNICYGFCDAGSGRLMAYGRWIAADGGSAVANFIRSTDYGATWAVAAAGDLMLASADPIGQMALIGDALVGGATVKSSPTVSEQAGGAPWGGAWTETVLPGTFTVGADNNVWAIAALDDGIGLASGGFIQDSGVANAEVLWLWRRTALATWSRIALANILQGAATTSVTCAALQRLSTNIVSVGYGYQDQPHAAAPGWRTSEDNGLTWTGVNNTAAVAPPDGTFYSPAQMAFLDHANGTGTLVAAAALDEGANGGTEIWVGAVTGLPFDDDVPLPDANSAVTPSVVHCTRDAFATASCRQAC